MAYLLLTGATGFLGGYLLRDLLQAEVRIAVLVRPGRHESAAARIDALLSRWERETRRALPRPVLLTGDVSEPDFGLDRRAVDWVGRNVDTVIHSAATLTFQTEPKTGEPWRSNVQGTRNLLALCRTAGIRRLHHVSTAYVCGLREGVVLESELDVGQQLGNDYEKSKLIAEQEVRAADHLDCVTIYRPSIIVGDSNTGYTSTYHGFYTPLRVSYGFVSKLDPSTAEHFDPSQRLGLSGPEGKNFVPVDWVSSVMTHLVTHPEHHGKTYHLTSPQPVSINALKDAFAAALGPHVVAAHLKAGGPASADRLSGTLTLASVFREQMNVYRSYWRDDPVFDCRNTQTAAGQRPCPELNHDKLVMLCEAAIRANFGWPRDLATEPEFDASARLEPLLEVQRNGAASRCVGLQLNGSGGGQWHLNVGADGIKSAGLGLPDDCAATYYLTTATLELLTQGRLTPQESIHNGRVLVLGNTLSDDETANILREFVTVC